jgi:hypothetical protein
MDPDTAIMQWTEAGLAKYWVKCYKPDEVSAHVGGDGAINQYRARMTDATWVNNVLTVRTKLLELESRMRMPKQAFLLTRWTP